MIEYIFKHLIDTSDATAAAGDIASGKTAYVNGEKITGTLENKQIEYVTSTTRQAPTTLTDYTYFIGGLYNNELDSSDNEYEIALTVNGKASSTCYGFGRKNSTYYRCANAGTKASTNFTFPAFNSNVNTYVKRCYGVFVKE